VCVDTTVSQRVQHIYKQYGIDCTYRTESEASIRVLYQADRHLSGGVNAAVVLAIRRRDVAPLPPRARRWLDDMRDWAADATDIYTDGAFKFSGSIAERMRGDGSIASGTAIVKRTTSGAHSGIFVPGAAHRSAFTAELLGQVMALGLRRRRMGLHGSTPTAQRPSLL
jgi:hypothetical protein